MSKATHDIMMSIGEYTDPGTGKKKKRYTKIGTQFMSDEGHISQVFFAKPNFRFNRDGYQESWLKLFPIEKKEQQPQFNSTTQPAPPHQPLYGAQPPSMQPPPYHAG
jgi:hypothetical protein